MCALVTLVHIFHSNFCEISHRVELNFFLVKKVEITFYGTLERSGARRGRVRGRVEAGEWLVLVTEGS